MRRVLLVTVLLTLVPCARSETADNSAATALARLRDLKGSWEGPFEWTGARSDRGTMSVTYALTGNGSAVVETLLVGGTPSMTTVYHLDGGDLRMTHFCGAQNQPRLKAREIDLARGVMDFAFVDATNLASGEAPHVDGFEMRLLDANHILLTFHFTSGGKASEERIDLRRVTIS